jgi:hypothetical protein
MMVGKHGIQTFKVVVVCCCFGVVVLFFCPTSTHPFLFLDKWNENISLMMIATLTTTTIWMSIHCYMRKLSLKATLSYTFAIPSRQNKLEIFWKIISVMWNLHEFAKSKIKHFYSPLGGRHWCWIARWESPQNQPLLQVRAF